MNRTVRTDTKSTVRIITGCAMLAAVSVILGIICKNLFTVGVYYRFTLENLGVIFAGILFGPFYGALVGLVSDAVSCLLSANPVINPIISAGAICVGAIAGIMSKYVIKKDNITCIALSAATAHIIGQVIIKSVGKIVYYGMPWWGTFIGLGCSAVAVTVEIAVIALLLKNRQIIRYKNSILK